MGVCLILVFLVIGPGTAVADPQAPNAAEDPDIVFAHGRTLLQQADFNGALQAFTDAARLAPKNQDYRRQAALVRRVIRMRERLGKMDGERWTRTARALHTFYHDNKIYAEALNLDRQIHQRLNNAESAAMLARTQLALKLNSDVGRLLSGLDDAQVTPETEALLGIALARQGKADEAKALVESVELPEEPTAELAFDFARLRALIGDEQGAADLLAHCFKSTRASRLAGVKTAARECPDFATLAGSDAFAAALKTESQVKESSCSEGPACGKCPHRAKCAEANEKKADGKKP